MSKEKFQIICTGCNKRPDELDEYIEGAEELGVTPDEFVKTDEGTFNSINGHFLCTDCYIKEGMPSLPYPKQWVAP